MTQRTILVCGLPRSGSSLTMRMLASAGIETTGKAPAFEDDRASIFHLDVGWLNSQPGRAIKLLDPEWHNPRIFDPDRFVVIFLSRDAVEQVKSGWKFTEWATGVRPDTSRGRRRAAIAGVERDTAKAEQLLRASGVPLLLLSFEKLIRAPEATSRQITHFLEPYFGRLNPFMMSRLVASRTAKCLPYMLEDYQIAGAAQ